MPLAPFQAPSFSCCPPWPPHQAWPSSSLGSPSSCPRRGIPPRGPAQESTRQRCRGSTFVIKSARSKGCGDRSGCFSIQYQVSTNPFASAKHTTFFLIAFAAKNVRAVTTLLVLLLVLGKSVHQFQVVWPQKTSVQLILQA